MTKDNNELNKKTKKEKEFLKNPDFCPYCEENDFEENDNPHGGREPSTNKSKDINLECLNCGMVIELTYTLSGLSAVNISEEGQDST